MPQKYRLSHADFARLSRARSRRIHGNYFSLVVVSLPEGSSVKAACVVSKKTAPRAVDRNRIERRAREALRAFLPRIQTPLAFVFHAKREAVRASFSEFRDDIQRLLARQE